MQVEGRDVHQDLHEMLFKLVNDLKDSNAPKETVRDFERFLLISHFIALRATCVRNGLKEQAARLAVSLLRYTADVPVDKAFFEAGTACRDMGWNAMAFVFFNRFVDLCDLIDKPEAADDIDDIDFALTDIPSPFDVPLPTQQTYVPPL